MTDSDIRANRLLNQQLKKPLFKRPSEVVSWMGGIQAQEYAMAKWSIGLRLPGSTENDIDMAFDKGDILRTHLMRPTWHFVSPKDIRWLLALTAPRVNAASVFMHRQLNLDEKTFSKCNDIIASALQGDRHLTRSALQQVLEQKGISADGLRLGYIMMSAELAGVVCSGRREGKQFTYALLEERVPAFSPLTRDEALAELGLRYFRSRGPATLKDFTTWSGLTMGDAKEAIAAIGSMLNRDTMEGEDYYFNGTLVKEKVNATFLMPDYDEYGIAYRNRSAINFKGNLDEHKRAGKAVYDRMVIADGKITGTWRRTIKGNRVDVDIVLFKDIKKRDAILKASKAFSAFIEKELVLNLI